MLRWRFCASFVAELTKAADAPVKAIPEPAAAGKGRKEPSVCRGLAGIAAGAILSGLAAQRGEWSWPTREPPRPREGRDELPIWLVLLT